MEYVSKQAVLDMRYHSEKYRSWVIDACDVEDLEAVKLTPCDMCVYCPPSSGDRNRPCRRSRCRW